MVPYYGDFGEDDTVNIPFNTFSSDDPSASVTITDLADADIKVHKDAHIDQIVTDGATVVINFDGITGNHMINIDTSVDAAYATGSEYQVRMEGTTVDGATINAWIGAFSIERAGGTIALLKLIQAAVITNAAGTDVAADIIALKAETVLIVEDTGELQTDDIPGTLSTISGYVDCLPASLNNLSAQNVRDAMKLDCTGNNPAAGSIDKHLDDIVADTNELQTDNIPGTLSTIAGYIDTEIGTLQTSVDDIPTVAEFEARSIVAADYVVVGDTIAGVTTCTTNTDLVTAANVKTAIEAAGSHLTLIKAVTDALTAAAAAKLALSAGVIVTGTVSWDNTNASTTVFYSDDIIEATADHFNGRIVIFTSGALDYQATDISDYELSAGEGKFTCTALTEAPADNVTFIII